MSNYDKIEKAYDILTDWLVDRSDNGEENPENFIPFEDIDEDIDLARSLVGEVLESMASLFDEHGKCRHLVGLREKRSRDYRDACAVCLDCGAYLSDQTGTE